MKMIIGGKELNIKFGYKPTLKERVISKVVKFSKVSEQKDENNMENIEDLLLYLPEFLLVGLQVNHKEYRYNVDTGEGKEKQLEKTFALIEEHMNNDDVDVMDIFNGLQEALTEDSFLSSLFRKEQKANVVEDAVQK